MAKPEAARNAELIAMAQQIGPVRVLITGMSATGKSTLTQRLATLGFEAVDADEHHSHFDPEGDWIWNERDIDNLLSAERSAPLFISGCASNQGRFYDRFDLVVLLIATEAVTEERLRTRTTNDFGKTEDERAKVLSDKAEFEPRLAATSDLVLDSELPIDALIDAILSAAERQLRRQP